MDETIVTKPATNTEFADRVNTLMAAIVERQLPPVTNMSHHIRHAYIGVRNLDDLIAWAAEFNSDIQITTEGSGWKVRTTVTLVGVSTDVDLYVYRSDKAAAARVSALVGQPVSMTVKAIELAQAGTAVAR